MELYRRGNNLIARNKREVITIAPSQINRFLKCFDRAELEGLDQQKLVKVNRPMNLAFRREAPHSNL